MALLCRHFLLYSSYPTETQTPFYLTPMLALPSNHPTDVGNAPSPGLSPLSHVIDDVGTQLLSVNFLCTILEGQVHCRAGPRSSLNLPAYPLYGTCANTGLGSKLSHYAGYRYIMIKSISKVRNTVRRLLGNGALPSPRAQEKPTPTPTNWYCHLCQTGPYSIRTQTGCTNVINGHQCDHRMCSYCRKE